MYNSFLRVASSCYIIYIMSTINIMCSAYIFDFNHLVLSQLLNWKNNHDEEMLLIIILVGLKEVSF